MLLFRFQKLKKLLMIFFCFCQHLLMILYKIWACDKEAHISVTSKRTTSRTPNQTPNQRHRLTRCLRVILSLWVNKKTAVTRSCVVALKRSGLKVTVQLSSKLPSSQLGFLYSFLVKKIRVRSTELRWVGVSWCYYWRWLWFVGGQVRSERTGAHRRRTLFRRT